jgi:hypothetical protein
MYFVVSEPMSQPCAFNGSVGTTVLVLETQWVRVATNLQIQRIVGKGLVGLNVVHYCAQRSSHVGEEAPPPPTTTIRLEIYAMCSTGQ